MDSTACSQCGEKILPHWTVCPVCVLPFTDVAANRLSHSETFARASRFLDLCCVQCKGILSPDAQYCPHCHLLIVRRYCSGCSRLIPEHAGMCPYCSTPASAKRSRIKFYLQSAIVLTIAVSIVAGVLFLVYRIPDVPSKSVVPLPVSSAFEQQAGDTTKPAELVPRVTTQAIAEDEKPAPVLPQEDIPLSASGPEDQFDSEPSVEDTNILEPIQDQEEEAQEGELQRPIPESPVVDGDWEARGARLKEGRKLTEKASLLMKQGRYSDASVVLTTALSTFPDKTTDLSYGEALYRLGICLRVKGQPERAIPILQEAMRFPYIRRKVLLEVEAATSQIKRTKLSQTSGTRP